MLRWGDVPYGHYWLPQTLSRSEHVFCAMLIARQSKPLPMLYILTLPATCTPFFHFIHRKKKSICYSGNVCAICSLACIVNTDRKNSLIRGIDFRLIHVRTNRFYVSLQTVWGIVAIFCIRMDVRRPFSRDFKINSESLEHAHCSGQTNAVTRCANGIQFSFYFIRLIFVVDNILGNSQNVQKKTWKSIPSNTEWFVNFIQCDDERSNRSQRRMVCSRRRFVMHEKYLWQTTRKYRV